MAWGRLLRDQLPWCLTGNLCCRIHLPKNSTCPRLGTGDGVGGCILQFLMPQVCTRTPESGKEEQSEELGTNCEQMLGRIMRNVWEAHQDMWMEQNNPRAPLAAAAVLEGTVWGGGTSLERETCAVQVLLPGAAPGSSSCSALLCSALVARQHRIRMQDFSTQLPCLHSPPELGKWRWFSLSFHLICGCRGEKSL